MADRFPLQHKIYTIATLLTASTVLVFMVWGFRNIQQDDSYIFYSYANNIANGNGYVFNVGERINATTSPLYTILLSVLYRTLRFLPFVTLPAVGHLIGGSSLFLTCFWLMKSFEDTSFSPVAFVLPLVFLANPLLTNAVGMETFLALMLGLMCLYFYAHEKPVATSLAMSFAVLGRPDMALLAMVLAIYHAVRKRRLPSLGMICAFLFPILTWVMFSLAYFGRILPTTLAAKLGQTESGRWGTGLIFLKGLWSPSIWNGYACLILMGTLVTLGTIVIVFQFRRWSIFRRPVLHLILLWSLVYLVVYGLILNPPAYPWYYTPFALASSVIISLLSEAIYRSCNITRSATNWKMSLAVGLGLALIGVALPLKAGLAPVTSKYEIYKLAAGWLNANAPIGANVGANEIGVLRYYYKNGPIIDALGLVTPGVAQHVSRGYYSWYIHEYKPDYLMFGHPHRPILEDMVEDTWFKERYALIKVISTERRSVAIYARVGQNHS